MNNLKIPKLKDALLLMEEVFKNFFYLFIINKVIYFYYESDNPCIFKNVTLKANSASSYGS